MKYFQLYKFGGRFDSGISEVTKQDPRRLIPVLWSRNEPTASFSILRRDFIGGTVDFFGKRSRHYMRLLCYQWSHGSIPADDERV